MKHLKILGLAAVISAALMAPAGSASATTITSPTGTVYTGTVHFAGEGELTLANPVANISCNSTIEGQVESHGSGITANLKIVTRLYTGCTNSWHTTTVLPGTYIIHWKEKHEGTVTSTGVKVDATRLGVTCVYETNNTSLGTLIGGNPATLKVEASIPLNLAESSALCGSGNAKWEGSYVTTSALYVAP